MRYLKSYLHLMCKYFILSKITQDVSKLSKIFSGRLHHNPIHRVGWEHYDQCEENIFSFQFESPAKNRGATPEPSAGKLPTQKAEEYLQQLVDLKIEAVGDTNYKILFIAMSSDNMPQVSIDTRGVVNYEFGEAEAEETEVAEDIQW